MAFINTGLNAGQIFEHETYLVYAADAGVEDAIFKIKNDIPELPNPYREPPDNYNPWNYTIADINGAGINVSIWYLDGINYRIVAIATDSNGKNTTVVAFIAPLSTVSSSVFDNAITALNGDITLTGNSDVTSTPEEGEGDVYANGNVSLKGNATVDGDANATGSISTKGNSEITGEESEGVTPIDPPDIDISLYLAEAEAGGTHIGNMSLGGNGKYYLGPIHITGNLSISSNATVTLQGTVYVDGSISMSGNSNIIGGYTIVAEGQISITGNTKLNLEDIPIIISTESDIKTTGNSWVSAVLYAPNGQIKLTGNSNLYGCAVGLSVSDSGNNDIEYITDLRDRDDLPGGSSISDWSILSWKID